MLATTAQISLVHAPLTRYLNTSAPNAESVVKVAFEAIKSKAGTVAITVWETGEIVQGLKNMIKTEEGLWDEFLENMVAPATGVSSRTLRRANAVYTHLDKPALVNALPKTVLYMLVEQDTPDTATAEILALEKPPSIKEARAIIQRHKATVSGAVEHAAERMADMLERTSDFVRELSVKWQVGESGVIPILEKFELNQPDALKDIALTGTLQWEGEKNEDKPPVPLAVATSDIAARVYASVCKARAEAEDEADRPEIYIRTPAIPYKAENVTHPETGEIMHVITFQVSESDMRRAETLIGVTLTLTAQALKQS